MNFAKENLAKNGYDQMLTDPEKISELKNFAADTSKSLVIKKYHPGHPELSKRYYS
jgi:hypothetical protein